MIVYNILIIKLLAPLIGVLALLIMKENKNEKNSLYVALWISGFVFCASLFEPFSFLMPIDLHTAGYLADVILTFNRYFYITGSTLLLNLLVASLILASVLISIDEIKRDRKLFSILVLLLETICIAIFSTTNIVIFYVCFEAILVPMFLIIGINGHNFAVGRKFFICLLFGSLFLLFAVIYILSITGTADFTAISEYHFSSKQQAILFTSIFISLAFKTALFPFHIWLPDAHSLAPTSASIILSGVFLKVGCYGFLIFFSNIFCSWSSKYGIIVCTIAAVNVVYGSYLACIQENLKRMIAYMSISHIGVIIIGIFANNILGISNAIFQMISHGITSCGLFIVDYIIKKYKNDNVKVQKLAFLSAPIFLSGMSFPLTSNFVGEFGILISTFNTYPFHCVAIIFSELLCIFFIFRRFKDLFFTSCSTEHVKVVHMSRIEVSLIKCISGFIVIFGVLLGHSTISFIRPSVKYWNVRC